MVPLQQKIWDVVVIGGGPAGMVAAAEASKRGKSVLLLEKNAGVGKKLLITGGGRCNVTNKKPDTRSFLSKYKGADKFLFSAFAQYDVEKTLAFFHSKNMPTKEENEGRIFPESNTARTVKNMLVEYMRDTGVEVRTHAQVATIEKKPVHANAEVHKTIFHIILTNKTTLYGRACVIATGGTSRPETGSTGDGYQWMKSMGHTIVENNFALVPVTLKDSWTKKLAGITLPDVTMAIFQNNKKIEKQKGKLLFTHVGVSGPTILGMSKTIGEYLQYGEVQLLVDLSPNKDQVAFKREMQTMLVENSNKKIKNSLGLLIPNALVEGVLAKALVDGNTPNHSVRSEERVRIANICKALPLHVKGLLGAEKAIVSSGGVQPEEIQFKTMESRKVPGLYIIGDMLNIDRPSGGYSLQLCWTTGYVAGQNC